MKRSMLIGVAAVVSLACIQMSSAADKKTLAFVVNGASDFWKAAEAASRRRRPSCRITSSSSSIPSSPRPRSRSG